MKKKMKIVTVIIIVLLLLLVIVMSGIVPKIYKDWATETSESTRQSNKKTQEVLEQNPDIKEKLKAWQDGEIELSDEEVKQIYDTLYGHESDPNEFD